MYAFLEKFASTLILGAFLLLALAVAAAVISFVISRRNVARRGVPAAHAPQAPAAAGGGAHAPAAAAAHGGGHHGGERFENWMRFLAYAFVFLLGCYLISGHIVRSKPAAAKTAAEKAHAQDDDQLQTTRSTTAIVSLEDQTLHYVARDPKKGDDDQPYVEVSVPSRDAGGAYHLYDEDSSEEMRNYTYRCHVNARGHWNGHWFYGADCGKSDNSPDLSVDAFQFIGAEGHSGVIHYRIGH